MADEHKSNLKTGIVAGVAAAATSFLIFASLSCASWLWMRHQEKIEAVRAEEVRKADQKVSADFIADAQKVVDQIGAEHLAASRGWEAARPSYDHARAALDQLSPQTSHEKKIFEGLNDSIHWFSLCLIKGISPKACEEHFPVGSAFDALKE